MQGAARQQMSVPDLVLTGHTENAEFALDISSKEPLVASGGKDTNVSPPSLVSFTPPDVRTAMYCVV